MSTTFARTPRLAAAVCAALLTLTACGGGDDEAKENLKESLIENGDIAGTELTDEEAGCLSDGMVDDIGTDKLEEIGLVDENGALVEDAQPDDLGAEDADALAATIVGCVDVQELLAEEMGPAMEQMGGEAQDCISEAFDEDTIEGLLSASFQGEEPDQGELQSKIMECIGAPTE